MAKKSGILDIISPGERKVEIVIDREDRKKLVELRVMLKNMDQREAAFWSDVIDRFFVLNSHIKPTRDWITNAEVIIRAWSEIGLRVLREQMYQWRIKKWTEGVHYKKDPSSRKNGFAYDWGQIEPFLQDIAARRDDPTPKKGRPAHIIPTNEVIKNKRAYRRKHFGLQPIRPIGADDYYGKR